MKKNLQEILPQAFSPTQKTIRPGIHNNGNLSNALRYLLLFTFFAFNQMLWGQTATTRYNQVVQGGATIIGTSWFYSTTVPASNGDVSGMLVPHADGTVTPSTAASTYSDLILPAGSTIVAAYLSVERTAAAGSTLSAVDIKVPGASSYTTISSSNWGSLSRSSKAITSSGYTFFQDIFNITSLITNTTSGYGTAVTGSSPGRFYLAKPTPAPDYMGGWSIIVVYTNPLSKYRSITVADNWQVFGIAGAVGINTDVNAIKVPSLGTVTAVVGVTGTYGDRGTNYKDYLGFGTQSGALTLLTDPSGLTTDNALNSSVAMTVKNNVTQDIIAMGGSGYFTGGNITTRNPISKGHPFSTSDRSSEAWEFDADIFDATGILPSSTSPVDVRFQQTSTGSDVLASGSYFVSVDLATAPVLTKLVSPTSISDGGTATYTWTITNTSADAVTQTGLGFTDALPTFIKVAAVPAIAINGTGTGGTVTAVAGSGTVTLVGLTLAAGASATIKVDVTNVAGQLNAFCGSNPSAFTNSTANITGTGILNTSGITPQCLVVNTACYSGYAQVSLASYAISNTCPTTTVNLNSLLAGSAPANSSLVWFINASHTGTALTAAQAAAVSTAGTYYAFFYDSINNCYNVVTSTSAVVVTINSCCAATAGTLQ